MEHQLNTVNEESLKIGLKIHEGKTKVYTGKGSLATGGVGTPRTGKTTRSTIERIQRYVYFSIYIPSIFFIIFYLFYNNKH